jgi:hypothetical protein
VNGRWLGAASAGRQYAPAALDERFCAALNFTVRPQDERDASRNR